MRRAARHFSVIFAYTAIAIVYSWPTLSRLQTAYIGPGHDATLFIWNLWYFRYAIHTLHTNPLWTDYIYWPYGASLLQQHYSLSHDVLGYFLQPAIGLPATYNVLMLLNYILGGYGVWLMARDWGCDESAAFVAGALYAFAPATSFSLFNGIGFDNQSVHVLPFFVWTLSRTVRDRRLADAVLCALALTWVWSCNLYYFLFCWLLLPLFFFALNRPAAVTVAPRPRDGLLAPTRRLLEFGLAAAAVWVLFSLPKQKEFHGQGSMRELLLYTLPYLLFWALLGLRLAAGYSLRVQLRTKSLSIETIKPYVAIAACWAALNWPMIYATLSFITTSDYGSTPHAWRGGGNPSDVFSLLVNYPTHFLWGRTVEALTARFSFLGVPIVPGLGLIPLAAAVWLARRRPQDPWIRLWFVGAIFSLIITLGPWLKVLGFHLYLPLPFFFLHLLPVYSNLQHGMEFPKFIMLFLALIFAAALTEKRRGLSPKRAALLSALAFALVAFEFLPRAVPMRDAAVSPLLVRLGARPDGAMLPVPMGAVFNGISAHGMLGYLFILPSDQATHLKPIVGGYLGRASPRIFDLMSRDAGLSALVDAQTNGKIPPRLTDPAFLKRWLSQMHLRYVLVEQSLTPPALQAAIAQSWPVRKIDEEGPLKLYEYLP